MHIARLIGRRLLVTVPLLLFLIAVVFILSKASGIDPARTQLGPNASAASIQQARHNLWLDRPVPLQYARYVDNLVHGDLGTSIRTRGDISTALRQAIPATVELAVMASLLAIIFGGALGVTSALATRGSGTLRMLMIAGASAPVFLTGLVCIWLLAGKLGWFPASGQTSAYDAPTGPTGFLTLDALIAGRPDLFFDVVWHMLLPAFCLALIPAAAIGRVLRNSLSASMGADYVRTARSKGLGDWKILRRHALRNSANAPLAMLGLQVGLIFAADIVVEEVFAWPGLGNYAASAITSNDFPVVAAVTLVIGIVFILVNALVDILQAVADPRMALER